MGCIGMILRILVRSRYRMLRGRYDLCAGGMYGIRESSALSAVFGVFSLALGNTTASEITPSYAPNEIF